ncbi:MAG: hypothetical protein JSV32_08030 [Dehalococcoidia bacterium]|nr:MAG: hypothetical protein JSV32_08030 [Dehalococcoidia bacterium]
MNKYYRNVQERLLVQRDIIRSLLKDPQIIGDYYEAIIRDAIRESISESFAVRRGVILSVTGETSRECDIIVYSAAEYGPLFLSENIVVVNPEAVRIVIQVKGTLNVENLKDAIDNLQYVNRLRKGIWKLVVGLKTTVPYEGLVNMCAQSRCVNGVFAFSTSQRYEKELIFSQMEKFVGLLKSITAPGMYQRSDAGNYVALETTGLDKFAGIPFVEE